jgi:hypothetical protein
MKTNQMNTKHISHLEDSILTGDLSVLDFFNGDYEVSLKIDGSPAIVWGTNPVTGNFFIGTKSVFNKVKLKINESHEDIDANHSGNVAQILHCCLDSLPRTEYIYQGDFIGFQGSKEYKPNTITYQFPQKVTQKIIVAPHTLWETENELKDAYVSGSAPFFVDTDDVKFIQPCVDYLHLNLPEIDTTGVQFLSAKEAEEAKKQINTIIRSGEELNWRNLIGILGCKHLSHLYLTMIELKEDLVDCMIVSDSPRAFIGDEEIVGEGFVLKNEKMIFKLVDRMSFSRSNFLMSKTW